MTTGRITRSSTATVQVATGRNQVARHRAGLISFAYEVGGRRFVGTRVGYRAAADPLRGPGAALAERYPVGATVAVHVDPRQPERAVLEPGADVLLYLESAIAALGAALALTLLLGAAA